MWYYIFMEKVIKMRDASYEESIKNKLLSYDDEYGHEEWIAYRKNIVKHHKDNFKHRFLFTNLGRTDLLVSNMVDIPFASVTYNEGEHKYVGKLRGRHSEEFQCLIGWRRNPTDLIKIGYSFIYDNKDDVLIHESIKESVEHYQRSLDKRFESSDESIENDTSLWEEVQSKESSDIFEYFSDKQKEIGKTWQEFNEVNILGLAGSGKTIILNEIFLSTDLDAWLVVPNFKLRNNAIKFINETSSGDKEQRIVTYDQLELRILNDFFNENSNDYEVFEYFTKQQIIVGSKKFSVRLPIRFGIIDSLIKNDITTFTPYDKVANVFYDRTEELSQSFSVIKNSISKLEKKRKKLQNKIKSSLGYDAALNETLEEDLRDINLRLNKAKLTMEHNKIEFKFIHKVKKSDNFRTFIRSEIHKLGDIFELFKWHGDEPILEIEKLSKNIDLKGCYIFDEAPMMVESGIILDLLPKMKQKVYGYDKYQYPYSTIQTFEDKTNAKKTYILDSIFRTTKEIFQEATKKHAELNEILPPYKAMISKRDSVTNEEQQDVVRLSDVMENPGKYWGVEFDNLTVIIDKEITRDNLNFYYLAATRAVKKLNIQYEN